MSAFREINHISLNWQFVRAIFRPENASLLTPKWTKMDTKTGDFRMKCQPNFKTTWEKTASIWRFWLKHPLPKTNEYPLKHGMLGIRWSFLFGYGLFSGAKLAVSFREGFTIHHPGISGFQYRLRIKPRDSHVLHLLNDAPNLQQQHPAVGNGCFLGGFWKIWRPNMWAFLAFFWPYYHPSGASRQHWIENLEAVKFAVKPTAFPLRIRLKKCASRRLKRSQSSDFCWS